MNERDDVAEPEPPDDLIAIPYADVARREQTAPVPPPLPGPTLLPFHALHPEMVERVVAEVVAWRRDNRGAYFYGRRGQKQHGLDVVARENDARTSLYQVKRYQQVTPTQLRDAVEEYAIRLPDSMRRSGDDRGSRATRWATFAVAGARWRGAEHAVLVGHAVVETRGIEPLTPALQRRCSAN